MAARTTASLNNLAVVYEAQGRLDDSASLGEESLAMYQRIHGSKLTVVLSNEGVECYNQISLHVTVAYSVAVHLLNATSGVPGVSQCTSPGLRWNTLRSSTPRAA